MSGAAQGNGLWRSSRPQALAVLVAISSGAALGRTLWRSSRPQARAHLEASSSGVLEAITQLQSVEVGAAPSEALECAGLGCRVIEPAERAAGDHSRADRQKEARERGVPIACSSKVLYIKKSKSILALLLGLIRDSAAPLGVRQCRDIRAAVYY